MPCRWHSFPYHSHQMRQSVSLICRQPKRFSDDVINQYFLNVGLLSYFLLVLFGHDPYGEPILFQDKRYVRHG